MTNVINEEVDINAYYFAGKTMRSFPRRISYRDRLVTFADGLRLSLQHGTEQTYLFDMNSTDGGTYRLRQDGSRWTLLGTY